MATQTDYYDILGVSKGASADEIKKHTETGLGVASDRHQGDKEAAEKRFKEINEAYQVLSDSGKRTSYDQFGQVVHKVSWWRKSIRGRTIRPFTYTYTQGGENPLETWILAIRLIFSSPSLGALLWCTRKTSTSSKVFNDN